MMNKKLGGPHTNSEIYVERNKQKQATLLRRRNRMAKTAQHQFNNLDTFNPLAEFYGA
jgi:hypothetical protein